MTTSVIFELLCSAGLIIMAATFILGTITVCRELRLIWAGLVELAKHQQEMIKILTSCPACGTTWSEHNPQERHNCRLAMRRRVDDEIKDGVNHPSALN